MVKITKKKATAQKPAPVAPSVGKAPKGVATPSPVGRGANLGDYLHPAKKK